jgi:hypothetical protein
MMLICTVQKDNWRDLPGVLEFRRESGSLIHLESLVEPVELSLLSMHDSEKIEAIEFLLESLSPEDLVISNRIFSVLFERLKGIEKARLIFEYQSKAIQPSLKASRS